MKLDIFDVGQIYFSFDDISTAKRRNKSIDNFFSSSYILGVVNFILKFIYFLIVGNKRFPLKDRESSKVLFYGVSRNNRLTLEPIINKMGEENVMAFVYQKTFPNWKLYWYAFPYLFDLIKIIRDSDKEKRQVLKMFFPKFWRMYGCPNVITEMLDIYDPKVVVMSNDHQEFNRCLMLMCKERGIDTIYVQHASVGTKFPPLQFSFSLLDGKDAYNKYKVVGGLRGNIYLMGGVRFDVIKPIYYELPDVFVIGVAINVIDEPEKVKKTCKALRSLNVQNKSPLVMLRPHPQMREKDWISWCYSNDIIFSSPRSETSFDFVGKSSIVIANQSSIHLDAAMCHKQSIIYNMSNMQTEDIYLYKKSGLVKEFDSIEDIQKFINCVPLHLKDKDSVQYFNCSYESSYEGNVSEIICHLINSIIKKDLDDFNSKYNFKLIERNGEYCVYKCS